ncbi:SDR family NAD(P)-dependent oxidoreductase [Actinomadura kijaniata]|uniref:SDR family NAD(P)-dependent oxidoreductase n=1 Tax=Actinomadura kijaniata TaxID=46161 RepID=UPI000A8E8538|nr:SDR family NAD(P)-dependent oxidoreductase [Actinomadura kijaniata]
MGDMTAVVTGANRGIGRAVAAGLLATGHDVVLVARDRAAGERAVAELGGGRLVVGDLSDLRAVRATAGALREACPRLDVLVHNAGVWPGRRVLNGDGLEQAFATNHLAPFVLNLELEPLLRASGTRVVQVSAGLYVKGRADPDRTPTGEDFHPMRTYADTKLCNVMMLPLWADRWRGTGVTIDAVHPGVVRTGLGDRAGVPGALLRAVKLLWRPPATGARPIVRLAVEDRGTGRYFHLDEQTSLDPPATDAALARRLWDQALKYGSAT